MSPHENLHNLQRCGSGAEIRKLLADVQLCNDGTIALDVLLGEVVEHAAALTDELVHAQTAVVVVGVSLEVLGQLTDTLGPDGDLNLGRAGVVLVRGVGVDDVGFLLFRNHGDYSFL